MSLLIFLLSPYFTSVAYSVDFSICSFHCFANFGVFRMLLFDLSLIFHLCLLFMCTCMWMLLWFMFPILSMFSHCIWKVFLLCYSIFCQILLLLMFFVFLLCLPPPFYSLYLLYLFNNNAVITRHAAPPPSAPPKLAKQ